MRPPIRALAVAAAAAALGLTSTIAYAEVTPATVDQAMAPGESITLTKTVTTPTISPKPDIVLMVDRTGSMGGAINDVKANMTAVIAAVEAEQPDAQWAVASYCDEGEDPFVLHSNLTASTTDTTTAVDSISLCGGGDTPEAQINALWEVGSGGGQVAFRDGSSRIVVWFGDAPGHDPSLGHTEADATASLTGVGARVVAINVGFGGLDDSGQATRITAATGGTLLSGVGSDEVADAIVEGLTTLDLEVTAAPVCDTGLSVTLDPATQTVASGANAVFQETITVAADAAAGATLECTVAFTINGAADESSTQKVSITVPHSDPNVRLCEIAKSQGPGTIVEGRRVVLGTGGSGHQIVLSTDSGNMTLSGGSGDDLLCAWGGNNTLDGGSGNDTLLVMEGANNKLIGGSGDDLMIGFAADTFNGGTGKNTILKK